MARVAFEIQGRGVVLWQVTAPQRQKIEKFQKNWRKFEFASCIKYRNMLR